MEHQIKLVRFLIKLFEHQRSSCKEDDSFKVLISAASVTLWFLNVYMNSQRLLETQSQVKGSSGAKKDFQERWRPFLMCLYDSWMSLIMLILPQ